MGGFALFARYARGLVVIANDTVTFDDSDDDEGGVYDEAVTVAVAVAVFVVFWTTEDDVWTSTSLFSVSATPTPTTATAATADVFEGCLWWEIWWWWYGYG